MKEEETKEQKNKRKIKNGEKVKRLGRQNVMKMNKVGRGEEKVLEGNKKEEERRQGKEKKRNVKDINAVLQQEQLTNKYK